MGYWKTLHLFDSKKFEEEVIPIMKGNHDILRSYFDKFNNDLFLDYDGEKSTDDRIKDLIVLSNKRSKDFKQYPEFTKYVENMSDPSDIWDFNPPTMSDFCDMLQLLVFSRCAITSPYFKLEGGRSLISLEYKSDNTVAEKYIKRIGFGGRVTATCFDSIGILEWLDHNDVKYLIDHYDEIVANDYSDELFIFLKIANQHELGVLTAIDVDFNILRKLDKHSIYQKVNFKGSALKNLLYEN